MTTLPRRLAHLLLALAVALGPALLSAPAAHAAPSVPATPERTSAQVPDPLRVGTEGVYAPFSIKQGDDFTGFDVEVMKAVGERLGVEVEFVATPWDSMFAALAAGRFDVVANQVNVNPEREKLYDLSDPYVDTAGVLVVAEDNPEGIEELSDLKGMRAAETSRAAGPRWPRTTAPRSSASTG